MTKYLRNFLNGVAFGITETVPGVSGGTIAIILGFYYELIETVNHFFKDIKKSLRFLIPLALGMVTGLVMFSSFIQFLLKNHSLPTMVFFIGLIVGIIPIIHDKVREALKKNPRLWLLAAGPIILLAVISYLKNTAQVDFSVMFGRVNLPFMLFLLLSGMVAAAALIIPGISGSFVLLIIGIYPLATYSVSQLIAWLRDMGNTVLLVDICKVLFPLGIGVVIGGLSMARLIEKLLKNHHVIVYTIILGLMLGSVYALFRDPIVFQSYVESTTFIPVYTIILAVVTFVCGCFISYNLGKKKL